MEVTQVYKLVNDITKEVLGEPMVQEDLSNVVEVGTAIFNANAVDKYVKSLVNHIGKVVFVNRIYRGGVPKVLMDAWEFGSVLEKVRMEMPDATENESWELEDGVSYDPNIFYKPKVSAKFFNKLVTFEVPISITERQVKQSFSNATQLNAFLSMIYTYVENSMTVKIEGLIMRTINNFIGETLYNLSPSGDYSTGNARAINLLALYNAKFPQRAVTLDTALYDTEFLKFASQLIKLYTIRMSRMSKSFNIGGKERFTPSDMLHVVLHSDFVSSVSTYLESDTFHNELVALPNYEEVPYWQSSTTDDGSEEWTFLATGTIDIKTASGNVVTAQGIIGVLFDRDALGVANTSRRTTTDYNAKAEFYNNWAKFDAEYFNDLDENFVVFYIA